MQNMTRRHALKTSVATGVAIVASDAISAEQSHSVDALRKLVPCQSDETARGWDADESLWLNTLLLDLKSIKPGTTRADLDNLLVSDGPTRTAKAHRYQHPKCPFIKFDVLFDVDDARASQRPEDKVRKVIGSQLDLVSNYVRF